MELCLYQGTFNPIHNAHLRVAEYVIGSKQADSVIFIPALIPPHKDCSGADSKDRLEMVKLATENNDKFIVSDIEYRLGGKSYTYRTICELYKEFNPTNKIKFIIGTDAFRKIETWYEADKLKEKVKFLVFLRDNNFEESEFSHLKDKMYDFELMPLSFEDISSSQIREEHSNLSEFVPPKVEEYIRNNGLYKN